MAGSSLDGSDRSALPCGVVRAHGFVDWVEGFGPSDHLCWAYRSRAELARVAAAWLGDGAQVGQRLVYVADRPREELLADLAELDRRDELLERGVLAVHPIADLYDLSRPIDAEAQLAVYAGAVEQAVADGFVGIRVVADITALVTDPARRAPHVHWELSADRWMATHPLAALCAYDEGALGDAVASVACVHPLRHVPTEVAPFSLWADDDGRIVLEGEADAFCVRSLADALAALPHGDDVVLDVSGLGFVDGRAATAVAAAAWDHADHGGSLRLHGARRAVRSVWAVLALDPAVLAA